MIFLVVLAGAVAQLDRERMGRDHFGQSRRTVAIRTAMDGCFPEMDQRAGNDPTRGRTTFSEYRLDGNGRGSSRPRRTRGRVTARDQASAFCFSSIKVPAAVAGSRNTIG